MRLLRAEQTKKAGKPVQMCYWLVSPAEMREIRKNGCIHQGLYEYQRPVYDDYGMLVGVRVMKGRGAKEITDNSITIWLNERTVKEEIR